MRSVDQQHNTDNPRLSGTALHNNYGENSDSILLAAPPPILTSSAAGCLQVESIFVIDESATELATDHPEHIVRHPEVPQPYSKDMRHRIVRSQADIKFDIVWDKLQTVFPPLVKQQAVTRSGLTNGNDQWEGQ